MSMIATPQVWVQTSFFRTEPGEDEQTNPGVYGRAFASWLVQKLESRDEHVQAIVSEDWGWCLVLKRRPYTLWIGCSNRYGRTNEWGAFVAAEIGFLRLLFRRSSAESAVARVDKLLHQLMHEVPGATNLWTEDA